MQSVNEFIFFDIKVSEAIDSSFCEIKKDENFVYLTYGLFAKDCLNENTENNYLFNIRIANAYFEKYEEAFDIHVTRQSICCNTQARLLEISNCKLMGIHRKIFIESAILFLLFQTQKNSLIFQTECNSCAVLNKPLDLEKIQYARNFILDNLSNNLTIPIIASKVGTNQCYLKKEFKEVFNQTIFEFIQENRMTKARYLLLNSEQNITDIAFTVGYSSLSSFSQAFKNYFGITPLEQSKAKIPNN